ncbi:MAG TPA: NAD(P)H-hydrate dehydratase [Gaiellales bacterium]|jgi:NAD(P)H-hydrate epimerase|nr:NAD(P)H-hydrate dehydratase [Gaiellales bacterium]
MNGTEPAYTAAEMQAAESRAIDGLGIPGIVLMERAGVAASWELLRRHPEAGAATILCGAGNNGGDGFVVARHLHAAGLAVEVFLTGAASRLSADSRTNFDIAARLRIPIHERVAPARLRRGVRRADLVVDALLGTGFSGRPRPGAEALIDAVSAAAGPVVSLDVPSGVDSSTGCVLGAAVEADLTVSFHARKVGLVVAPGRFHAGSVTVADIGIPPQVAEPTAVSVAGREVLAAVPGRSGRVTKYSAGSVLVLGGAPGYTGAPALTALAALRAGAGIVWVAAPAEAVPAIAAHRPEPIVRPLPEALELVERAGALAIGPGLGRDPQALEQARELAIRHAGPVVVDADALFAFAADLAPLARRRLPAVLTPHEGEMGRLLGEHAEWVRENRLEAVRRAAADAQAVVLLKGADTLVAEPDGTVTAAPVDVPGLATAGSGDVLTGAIAALLARGMEPREAAVCGAVAHGLAGAAAAAAKGPAGIIAGDVIDALPASFSA